MAVLALMALAIPASAADLPTRMPVKAPIVPVWSWTGFYVGANLGYSWGRSSTDAASGRRFRFGPPPSTYPPKAAEIALASRAGLTGLVR
jgi:opacity protein-like surface antigen